LSRAGKSTLLSLLAGYLHATSGFITFERDIKIPLGIVPQKNVLLDELTCEQTVKLFYDLKTEESTLHRERSKEIQRLLDDVGLWPRRSSRASELSGGMKRRLQLAIGMAGKSECKISLCILRSTE
jgi:ATP-binding cassette, subfamily A (ABC1), member 3